jgi:ERF superfamily
MHRSSDTIATLAAALARAQMELTNPEKSIVATIRSPFPREADRTFRYAPLSSGLDIVRKSLGRHEIATIQATEIDKEAGLLRLTTVLAHSSGEWISSDWPVCQISDIASAQRVGAALTYARRYALFTLVGIAGEDDLDAPDLTAEPNPSAPAARLSHFRRPENGQTATAQSTPRHGKLSETSARTVLGTQLSASLRESLIKQLQSINSADEAAAWARRNLPAKNTLAAADARMVEEKFQARLSTFSDERVPESEPRAGHKSVRRPNKQSRSKVIHALGKTVRLRDKDHRKYVLRQPCLVCGRVPSDPHHLTFTQPRALGRRVSDEFTVPICRLHHRELHRSGDEAAWWRSLNIDPLPVALKLWKQTRSDDQAPAIADPRTEPKPAAKDASSDRASETPV